MTTKKTTEKQNKPDVVGLHEIAERLKVPVNTVRVWRARGVLPPEDYMLNKTPGWLWATIVAWHKVPRPTGNPGHKPKVPAA